jgi:hypothetical protein
MASTRATADSDGDRGLPLSDHALKTVLTARLAEVEHRGLYRRLCSVNGAQEDVVSLDGREVLLFSSNNRNSLFIPLIQSLSRVI